MDWLMFAIIGVSYVIMMHMMVGVEKNFTYWLHIWCFGFGAFVGWYMDSHMVGLVVAMCFHLLLTCSAFG